MFKVIRISVQKIFQNEEKWLINVNKEPDMINTTLDIGRNLESLSWFLAGLNYSTIINIF